MDINTLLSLVVTALITGIIAFIFWLLQRTIGDRITVKREDEKERKRKEEEQYRKWLGPDGVAPKDEKEAVRIAKREGHLSKTGSRRVPLPGGISIILLFIVVFILVGPLTQRYLATPSETPSPDELSIISPENGANLNCQQDDNCIVNVAVKWMPEAQAAAQGLHLSIWVKPYPNDATYLFYSQVSPVNLEDGTWQSGPVYIGQVGDKPGTSFAIYAIVTDQPYNTGEGMTLLPPHSEEDSVEVFR